MCSVLGESDNVRSISYDDIKVSDKDATDVEGYFAHTDSAHEMGS